MTRGAKPSGGIYGKVPAFGDFLHRGLPSGFVEPWNAWVGASITDTRAILGEGWMHAYLTSPPWRFIAEPGIFGRHGWVGVFASSVDGVGRAYPICAAAPLGEEMRLHWLASGLQPMVDRLEGLALDLIDGRRTPESALDEIGTIAPLAADLGAPAALLGRGGTERLVVGGAPSRLAGLALRWLGEVGAGAGDVALSAWWHGPWSDRPAAALICDGLPNAETFAGLLDGAWADRGWSEQLGDRGRI